MITYSYCFPWLIDDMAVVIRQCLSDPPRLKSGQFFFLKKTVDELAPSLVALPEFLPFLPEDLTADVRLACAVEALYALKLVDKQGLSSRSMNLVITANGHHWLNDSLEDKLRIVLTALRDKREIVLRYLEVFPFYSSSLLVCCKRSPFDFNASLYTAFTSMVSDEWIELDSFIALNNPFYSLIKKYGIYALSVNNASLSSEREADVHWNSIVIDFIFQRLAPLGVIEFAVDDLGHHLFRVKPSCAFLFGIIDSFSISSENERVLIVQPDFDLIFLSPQQTVEAECAPFCERLSSGIGTLFKLTRESVLQSISLEYTADRVFQLLERFSLQPIPDNVRHELTTWYDSARSISVATVELVTAPDDETARRIVSICGTDVRLLAGRYVELVDDSKRKSVLSVLRKHGIVLQ